MKSILALFIIMTFVIIGWIFSKDYSLCSIIFINCLLLIGYIFPFPSYEWILYQKVKQDYIESGNEPIMFLKSSITINSKVRDILSRAPIIENHIVSKTRIRDTDELIEEVKEAIAAKAIPYIFILIGSIFTYFLIKKEIEADQKLLHYYKNYFTLIYVGVAFCLIAWNIRPLFIQRKKNKLNNL